MNLQFDHLFICTAPGAPEVDRLIEFGLVEGSSNTHPGQGTTNRRIFFANAMLEFLWVYDEAECRSRPIARTQLWERSRSQQTGYAPFGLSLRSAGQTDQVSLPFETWAFKPPYLPDHLQIDVAANDDYPAEPMIFHIPFGGRPDQLPADRRQPIDHPIGFKEITKLKIRGPQLDTLSPVVQALDAMGWVSFAAGPQPLAEIWFDQGSTDQSVDFQPGLPLIFHW